jgi:hypothetical protein
VKVTAVSGNLSDATKFHLSNSSTVTASADATDERGVAGFVNVVPQNVDVTAVADLGVTVAEGITIPIRPNTITQAELRFGIDRWGQ